MALLFALAKIKGRDANRTLRIGADCGEKIGPLRYRFVRFGGLACHLVKA